MYYNSTDLKAINETFFENRFNLAITRFGKIHSDRSSLFATPTKPVWGDISRLECILDWVRILVL